MIQVNEIRVGNWVRIRESDSKIQIDRSDFEYGEYVNYLPIPLTPEILENCGFVGGVKLQNFVDGRHQFMQKDGVYGHFSEKGYFDFCWGPRIKVKYLHQLQNLYFALTSTELEIKM